MAERLREALLTIARMPTQHPDRHDEIEQFADQFIEAQRIAASALAAVPQITEAARLREALNGIVRAADTYPPEIMERNDETGAWRLGGAARRAWNDALCECRAAIASASTHKETPDD